MGHGLIHRFEKDRKNLKKKKTHKREEVLPVTYWSCPTYFSIFELELLNLLCYYLYF